MSFQRAFHLLGRRRRHEVSSLRSTTNLGREDEDFSFCDNVWLFPDSSFWDPNAACDVLVADKVNGRSQRLFLPPAPQIEVKRAEAMMELRAFYGRLCENELGRSRKNAWQSFENQCDTVVGMAVTKQEQQKQQ